MIRALWDQLLGVALIPVIWLVSMGALGAVVGRLCRQRSGLAVAIVFGVTAIAQVILLLSLPTLFSEWRPLGRMAFFYVFESWIVLTMPGSYYRAVRFESQFQAFS